MKKLNALLLMLLFIVFIDSASSQTIINSFMDPEIPVRGHALIIVDPRIGVSSIDGELQLKAGAIDQRKSKMIFVIPGIHAFTVVWYSDLTQSHTINDPVGLRGNFLAGHIYRIEGQSSGNSIQFQIVEETDLTIWNSKDVTKVKLPKKGKTNYTVVFQKAAATAPTKLEGNWSLIIPPRLAQYGTEEMLYSFNGSTYTLSTTIILNPQDLKATNELRRIKGLPPLTSPIEQSGMRGTITINENRITALWIQQSVDLEYWQNMQKPVETVYEYSISPEGNILLKVVKVKGAFAMGAFLKNETGVLVKEK